MSEAPEDAAVVDGVASCAKSTFEIDRLFSIDCAAAGITGTGRSRSRPQTDDEVGIVRFVDGAMLSASMKRACASPFGRRSSSCSMVKPQ